MEQTHNTPFGGPLTVYTIDQHSGLMTPKRQVPHNLVVYEAADIQGRLLAGDTDYFVSHMYFEFTNGAVPAVTPQRSGGQSYYNGLGASYDFLRVAIDMTPETSASDSNYASNQVYFFGATAGSVGAKNGLTFTTGSKVYGGAIAASPTGAFSGDLVFARFYFDEIQKTAGSQIGVKWPVTFS